MTVCRLRGATMQRKLPGHPVGDSCVIQNDNILDGALLWRQIHLVPRLTGCVP